jgi:hypothetical protein
MPTCRRAPTGGQETIEGRRRSLLPWLVVAAASRITSNRVSERRRTPCGVRACSLDLGVRRFEMVAFVAAGTDGGLAAIRYRR